MQFTEIFRGKTVDVSKRSVTVEITGTDDKIEAFENMVRPFGLIELIRTGEIAALMIWAPAAPPARTATFRANPGRRSLATIRSRCTFSSSISMVCRPVRQASPGTATWVQSWSVAAMT